MRRTEKFALVAAIVYVVSAILQHAGRIFAYTMVSSRDSSGYALASMSSVLLALLMLAGHIVVGVWLFRVARHHRGAAWVWFTTGLVFGLSAAILYYCMKIYEKLNAKDGKANKVLESPF